MHTGMASSRITNKETTIIHSFNLRMVHVPASSLLISPCYYYYYYYWICGIVIVLKKKKKKRPKTVDDDIMATGWRK